MPMQVPSGDAGVGIFEKNNETKHVPVFLKFEFRFWISLLGWEQQETNNMCTHSIWLLQLPKKVPSAIMAEGPAPAPEAPREDPTPSLEGLAAALEGNQAIRSMALKTGQLLQWPSPASTGVINFTTMSYNYAVVHATLSLWCPKVSFPKTIPIDETRDEEGRTYPNISTTTCRVHKDTWYNLYVRVVSIPHKGVDRKPMMDRRANPLMDRQVVGGSAV